MAAKFCDGARGRRRARPAGRVLEAGGWGRGRAREAWGCCCGQLEERAEELDIKAPARSEAGHDDGSRGGGGWLQGQRWSSRERGDGIERVLLALAVCGGGGQRERGREEGIGIERRECGLGLRDRGVLLGLSSPSLLFLFSRKVIERRKRKIGLGKNLHMRVIFPDSQKYARSKKNGVGKIARFKFKCI